MPMREQFLKAIGWSHRQCILFLVVLIAFVLVFPIASVVGFNINNSLLWLTGVVVLVYTVETQGLRLEMVRQNEMAVQPLVIATIEAHWEERIGLTAVERMVIKNIGRGPALHVHAPDIEFEKLPGGRFVYRFDRIDYLEPGQDRVINVEWHGEFEGESESRPNDAVSNLKPSLARGTYDVTILYNDISGKQDESVVRMGKGGIRLLSHGKVS